MILGGQAMSRNREIILKCLSLIDYGESIAFFLIANIYLLALSREYAYSVKRHPDNGLLNIIQTSLSNNFALKKFRCALRFS